MLSGLTRVGELVPGTGYVDLTAGVLWQYGKDYDAYARVEAGGHLDESTSIFGFAEARLKQISAGVGLRKTF